MNRPEPGRCCTTGDRAPGARDARQMPVSAGEHRIEQCAIPAGVFSMGDSHGDGRTQDGETPVHEITLDAFGIDATTVTNADFAAFVAATGYRTDAETYGSSAVFHHVVAADPADVLSRSPQAPWWWDVRGADWRHPEGPRSHNLDRPDHPVVHVSWNDAQSYCRWAGRALPTEAQWERAARGGLDGARYPWGDDPPGADGTWRANIWQGRFPVVNTAEDGWLTTAPVRTYAPNGFGLWQAVGNVWEWCADTYDPRAYARRARGTAEAAASPAGDAARVLRGGSYLCHDSYCNRYRNAARSANTPDSSMGNAGFRTAALPGV